MFSLHSIHASSSRRNSDQIISDPTRSELSKIVRLGWTLFFPLPCFFCTVLMPAELAAILHRRRLMDRGLDLFYTSRCTYVLFESFLHSGVIKKFFSFLFDFSFWLCVNDYGECLRRHSL